MTTEQILKIEQDVLAKLTPILGTFGIKEPITNDTIFEQVAMDSLDIVELCMECEDEFDVEISDNAVEQIKTVGDLVSLLARKTTA